MLVGGIASGFLLIITGRIAFERYSRKVIGAKVRLLLVFGVVGCFVVVALLDLREYCRYQLKQSLLTHKPTLKNSKDKPL